MGRLFWKLFTAFWFAFAVITVGVLSGMKLYREHIEREIFQNSSLPETHTIASVLAEEGEQAAIRLMRELRISQRRIHIVVVDNEGRNLLPHPFPPHLQRLVHQAIRHPLKFPQREVTTPSGNSYHVISLGRKDRQADSHRRHWLDIQSLVLVVAGLVSLILCFLLARYLSRPIKELRSASRDYAKGKLDIRVSPQLGRRRDEIADLAQDFDQMAEQLQSLINGQQQLLRDISHELRSPLTRLQMAVGLARKRLDNRAKPDGLNNSELNRIERDVKRLEQLISQVLTLSRLETSVTDTRTDLVDIESLLTTIVEDVQFEANTNGRQLRFTTNCQPTMLADGELLRQAIENIIRNGVKYTEPDSEVSVTLTPLADGFAIDVCDNGPGVPEAMLDALFDPFVRTSEARERDSGGYGLGLAIAKRAVEMHGGCVAAHNRQEGGLCITIHFATPPTK